MPPPRSKVHKLTFPDKSGTEDGGSHTVTRCVLCGRAAIAAAAEGRFVTTACSNCHAVLRIEFHPPDQPHLTARIERLDDLEDQIAADGLLRMAARKRARSRRG